MNTTTLESTIISIALDQLATTRATAMTPRARRKDAMRAVAAFVRNRAPVWSADQMDEAECGRELAQEIVERVCPDPLPAGSVR